MRAVFVHGSGRSGSDAWPTIDGHDYVFVARPGFGAGEIPQRTDFDAEAKLVMAACEDGAHLIAASYGALAALGAAAIDPTRINSLVLVEPAAFSLGRGLPAIEAHIAAVAPVMARSADLDPADFQVQFFEALGVVDVERPRTGEAIRRAERMRLQRPPWEADLDGSVFGVIPTLVVTGAWNPEYEQLAVRLTELGAGHVQLPGFGHAAQESPDFPHVLIAFWGRS